jgi:tetratricopeptide (TPR) repeat protein
MRSVAVGILILCALTTALQGQRAAILAGVTTVQVEATVVPNPKEVEDFAPAVARDALVNALRQSAINIGESDVRAHIVLEQFTLGIGRHIVAARLVFVDAFGIEMANTRIRVTESSVPDLQDRDAQRAQAIASFGQHLSDEIAGLKADPNSTAAPRDRAGSVENVSLETPGTQAGDAPRDAETGAGGEPDFARVLEAAARSENARNWASALQHYQRARQIDPSMAPFIDASIARVRAQMGPDAQAALRRARQYDALGRAGEAITWYERALLGLATGDKERDAVERRLAQLRAGEP